MKPNYADEVSSDRIFFIHLPEIRDTTRVSCTDVSQPALFLLRGVEQPVPSSDL